MSAYIVFARDSTQDRAELETYWSKIKATMEGHPIKVLAAYGKLEVLESGPAIEGAVIAEFPTMEAAKAWFYSPAYQEAAQHRLRGASYRGFIIEGI